MELNELAYLVALHNMEGIGSRSLEKIKGYFGSFQSCFFADRNDLHRSFLPAGISDKIVQVRKQIDPVIFLHNLSARGINITTLEDTDYPSMLASIHDPPYLIYYNGQLDILQGLCIGIVGSRKASSYGRNQARRFGNQLASLGVVVVSGMARGIDTEAHRGALEAGGKTAAILGSGLDVVYPPENTQLYQDIANQGVVISEFPVYTHPEPGNFPVRNRIISGLSRGILVIEAQKKSGALITADFALEQGRDVFALPGPVNSKNSEGTNNLIKQGAGLVSEPADIIMEYRPGVPKAADLIQNDLFNLDHLSQIEKQIIDSLDNEMVHFDVIMYKTALNVGVLSTHLLQMELKGIINSLPGNYYQVTGT